MYSDAEGRKKTCVQLDSTHAQCNLKAAKQERWSTVTQSSEKEKKKASKVKVVRIFQSDQQNGLGFYTFLLLLLPTTLSWHPSLYLSTQSYAQSLFNYSLKKKLIILEFGSRIWPKFGRFS